MKNATGLHSPSAIRGVLAGLIAATIWAAWSIATRFAVTTNLGPHDVTFLRFGIASLFLWPILFRTDFRVQGSLDVRLAVVMLIGAGVPFMWLASAGVTYAPASHIATLMIGLMPVFVALFSWMFLGERFGRVQFAGVGLVVLGIVFFFWDSRSLAALAKVHGGETVSLSSVAPCSPHTRSPRKNQA